MKIIDSPQETFELASGWKRRGLRVAVVPTMGCLHEGHLSLMRIAGGRADRVIVTLFVNPLQFGPNEDLDAYPKQFKLDCELAESEGVDVVFAPGNEVMYDGSFQTTVNVNRLSMGLCGGNRPGHFSGVATVVAKLFNITAPDIAVFGEKDFQQLAIIRQLVKDLNFPVEVVGGPTVRERDGLAMSSRNKYLKGEWREVATCLYNAILAARKIVAESGGGVLSDTIVDQTKRIVSAAGAAIEYAAVVNESSLKEEKTVTPASVLVLAAKIGGTVRLIDNGKLIA